MYFHVNFNVFFKLIKVHLLVSEHYIQANWVSFAIETSKLVIYTKSNIILQMYTSPESCMWNARATAVYFGSNSPLINLLTLEKKPGGGESTVDSVTIHTCLLWSEAALIFSDYLA